MSPGGSNAAPSNSGDVPVQPQRGAVLVCVSGPHQGKQIGLYPGKPFSVAANDGQGHSGSVEFSLTERGVAFLNNSPIKCRVNGERSTNAMLGEGDEVKVGGDVFRLRIERKTNRDATPLASPALVAESAAIAAKPGSVGSHLRWCSRCDVLIDLRRDSGLRSRKAGEQILCSSCVAAEAAGPGEAFDTDETADDEMDVANDQHDNHPTDHDSKAALPVVAGSAADAVPAENATVVPVITDDAPAAAAGAALHDEVDVVEPVSADHDHSATEHYGGAVPAPLPQRSAGGAEPGATRPSGPHRRSGRKISASQIAQVDAQPANKPGLLQRMGELFRRKDPRATQLEALVAERQQLLFDFGRIALERQGGFGLRSEAFQSLIAGEAVTLRGDQLDIPDRERFRSAVKRLQAIDAQVVALRQALGLGTERPSQGRLPTLATEDRQLEDRAFAAMDDVNTGDLSGVNPSEGRQPGAAKKPKAPPSAPRTSEPRLNTPDLAKGGADNDGEAGDDDTTAYRHGDDKPDSGQTTTASSVEPVEGELPPAQGQRPTQQPNVPRRRLRRRRR